LRIVDEQIQLSASDLSAHLGCQHRTQLDRRSARGEISPPVWQDPLLEVLRVRGQAHEKAYIEHLRDTRGLDAIDLRDKPLDATSAAKKPVFFGRLLIRVAFGLPGRDAPVTQDPICPTSRIN